MSVCYWPVVEPQLYSPDKFPCFIFCASCGRRDIHVYGFPGFEYPGLIKVKSTTQYRATFEGAYS